MQFFYRLAIILTLLVSAASGVSAQKRNGNHHADRQKWEAEMTQYKHDRLVKELGLNDEQATRFFALYDAMDRERRAVYANDTRMRKEMKRKTNPADKDYTEATRVSLSVGADIHRIESKYYKEFDKILTPKQVYQLRLAEQKSTESFAVMPVTCTKASKRVFINTYMADALPPDL